ncbi:MAG: 1-deoxy-D-xylulose-5-phosphate reductoisomerase [Nitrospiraceae bacterium]|nr:1-deoxy-D-xylulose-5-phosphate reductoisomerase [Nitrospiraceae bacterium]
MKRIIILGSTGSIGKSALEVVEKYPERFKVVALAACKNHELLFEQIKKFKPEIAALSDPAAADILAAKAGIPVLSGEEGLKTIASYAGASFVISAIVGFAGLAPTLAAIRSGKDIGLANKEALVTAGSVVMEEAGKYGVKILPVDSEHSAVFQCIDGRPGIDEKAKHNPPFEGEIILTASGGPFLGKSRKELESMTPNEAVSHPNWKMGKKISVDSATLMNKGLEVIEAHHLFQVPPERIKVLVHPQSLVHSMVEFQDGSLIAQLSVPDMKAPIAYALSYPERLKGVIPRLDLTRAGNLSFMSPDTETFPCLLYAYDAIREGGTAPAVLNAANEIAVEAFLSGAIGFNDIPVIIKNTMQSHSSKNKSKNKKLSDERDAVEADSNARRSAARLVEEIKAGKRR